MILFICHKLFSINIFYWISYIGAVLEQLEEDRFEELYDMIWFLIDSNEEEEKNSLAEERKKRASFNLKEVVCLTMGMAWPNTLETQQKYQLMFVEKCVQCLQNNTRPVQIALLIALRKYVERLKILDTNTEGGFSKKCKKEGEEVIDKICNDILTAIISVSGKSTFENFETNQTKFKF